MESLGQEKALRILAKSVYRELKSEGYGRSEIVAFTSELLELVTSDFRHESRLEDGLTGSEQPQTSS